MEKSRVAISKGGRKPDEREIEGLVREALALLGGCDDIIGPGKHVLIKPNVTSAGKVWGEVTDLRVVRALAKIVREKGAHVTIAEAASVGMDTEKLFEMYGYYPLRDEGYELVDLKKTETVKVPVVGSKTIKEIEIYKMVLDADTVITVPVLKTHFALLVTLSLKNMKGTIPDREKRRFHLVYGVEEGVAHLNQVIRPQLAVIDAIHCSGGAGPNRTTVEVDAIIASRDPVAADSVGCQVMGIDPRTVPQLKIAEGIGGG